MEMPVSEIIDRYSILLLKDKRIPNEDLSKEVEYYKNEIPGELLHYTDQLYDINRQIWDLEADIRSCKESRLGLEEVGKRAIKIRDLNKQRVSIKNKIVEETGQGFKDIKVNHISADINNRKDNGCNDGKWGRRWEYMKEIGISMNCSVIKRNLTGWNEPTTERYKEQLIYLLKHFNKLNDSKIIEIGPAFGGLYKEIYRCKFRPSEYIMVDGDPMLKLIDEYLTETEKKNVKTYLPNQLLGIEGHFDICISNFCINETNDGFQNNFYNDFCKRCDRFFALIDPHKVLKDYEDRLGKIFKVINVSDAFYHEPLKRRMVCIYAENKIN